MISALLTASLVILALAMLACLFRLLKGPTRSDRVAALDTIGIHVLAIIAVVSMQLNTQDFLEIYSGHRYSNIYWNDSAG